MLPSTVAPTAADYSARASAVLRAVLHGHLPSAPLPQLCAQDPPDSVLFMLHNAVVAVRNALPDEARMKLGLQHRSFALVLSSVCGLPLPSLEAEQVKMGKRASTRVADYAKRNDWRQRALSGVKRKASSGGTGYQLIITEQFQAPAASATGDASASPIAPPATNVSDASMSDGSTPEAPAPDAAAPADCEPTHHDDASADATSTARQPPSAPSRRREVPAWALPKTSARCNARCKACCNTRRRLDDMSSSCLVCVALQGEKVALTDRVQILQTQLAATICAVDDERRTATRAADAAAEHAAKLEAQVEEAQQHAKGVQATARALAGSTKSEHASALAHAVRAAEVAQAHQATANFHRVRLEAELLHERALLAKAAAECARLLAATTEHGNAVAAAEAAATSAATEQLHAQRAADEVRAERDGEREQRKAADERLCASLRELCQERARAAKLADINARLNQECERLRSRPTRAGIAEELAQFRQRAERAEVAHQRIADAMHRSRSDIMIEYEGRLARARKRARDVEQRASKADSRLQRAQVAEARICEMNDEMDVLHDALREARRETAPSCLPALVMQQPRRDDRGRWQAESVELRALRWAQLARGVAPSTIAANLSDVFALLAPDVQLVSCCPRVTTLMRGEVTLAGEAMAAWKFASCNRVQFAGWDESTKFGDSVFACTFEIELRDGTVEQCCLRGLSMLCEGGTSAAILRHIEQRVFAYSRGILAAWKQAHEQAHGADSWVAAGGPSPENIGLHRLAEDTVLMSDTCNGARCTKRLLAAAVMDAIQQQVGAVAWNAMSEEDRARKYKVYTPTIRPTLTLTLTHTHTHG